MPRSKYIYNSSSLRYDRAKRSALSVVFTGFGLLFFGTLFFALMVFIQNYFIETPLEKSLISENTALAHYRIELAADLDLAQLQMRDLESKDKSLYEKIFEIKKVDIKPSIEMQSDKQILLADVSGFHDFAATLLRKFTDLNITAHDRSNYFGERTSVKKKDIAFLKTVPSYAPVADFNAIKLVSGYGIRINPFHKRNYHHDGIDIASPRGSEVLAAASGKVSLISHSDLEAGFGNYIEIDHGNGYVTRYANLGTITTSFGQQVNKGQAIGLIGISGGSVAPHVHYEVLHDGKNMDPAKFLIHGINAGEYELIWQASTKQNQSLD